MRSFLNAGRLRQTTLLLMRLRVLDIQSSRPDTTTNIWSAAYIGNSDSEMHR